MTALITLLFIIVVSYHVVRAGTVALTMTGMSADSASFQAQSAFMGVGFTTSESESVVNHPARRRVIGVLMLLGNLSVASGLAGIVTTFWTGGAEGDVGRRILVLSSGCLAIFLITRIKFVRSGTTRLLEILLVRLGQTKVHDYAELLRVEKGFAISSLVVEQDSWMSGHPLRELRLTDGGVILLNVVRGSSVVIATPGPNTVIEAGDTLLLYGLYENLSALATRETRGEVQDPVPTTRPEGVQDKQVEFVGTRPTRVE